MFPKDIGSLSFLQDLDLQGNEFCNLQTDFASLTNLCKICFDDCSKLQSIFSLPRSLSDFKAENCISLERIPDLSECPRLGYLFLSGCLSLGETPGIHNCKFSTKKLVEVWLKRNHECIYLPGYDLPNWIRFKAEMRSFSFTVPETHNSGPAAGFTLWTSFQPRRNPEAIAVMNLTRGSLWKHRIGGYANYFPNDFHIETGDQIFVYVVCDDTITILETGFALAYVARDSSDFSSSDGFFYDGHHMNLMCFRAERQAFVTYFNRATPELYACSIFPETSRYQENNQPVIEESHHRPRRKMRMGLSIILGVIIFLTLALVLGNYG